MIPKLKKPKTYRMIYRNYLHYGIPQIICQVFKRQKAFKYFWVEYETSSFSRMGTEFNVFFFSVIEKYLNPYNLLVKDMMLLESVNPKYFKDQTYNTQEFDDIDELKQIFPEYFI